MINNSRPYNISKGLNGQHVALWQSHGKYFINDKKEWGWQRPRLFSTTEDQFTQSFILPYVIPMLQNAGAVVYTPRERDTQKQEVIVDNDTQKVVLFIWKLKAEKHDGKKQNLMVLPSLSQLIKMVKILFAWHSPLCSYGTEKG